MASRQFIATSSPTRFAAGFPATGAYPRALRIDGHTVNDPTEAFYVIAMSTNGSTTSGGTDPNARAWSLFVDPSRYKQLCEKAKRLQDLVDEPCTITVSYEMVDPFNAVADDVTIDQPVILPLSLFKNVENIAGSNQEIADTSSAVLHELRRLNELVGHVLLRLPIQRERERRNPVSEPPESVPESIPEVYGDNASTNAIDP